MIQMCIKSVEYAEIKNKYNQRVLSYRFSEYSRRKPEQKRNLGVASRKRERKPEQKRNLGVAGEKRERKPEQTWNLGVAG